MTAVVRVPYKFAFTLHYILIHTACHN